jgi:hypothetical protein
MQTMRKKSVRFEVLTTVEMVRFQVLTVANMKTLFMVFWVVTL